MTRLCIQGRSGVFFSVLIARSYVTIPRAFSNLAESKLSCLFVGRSNYDNREFRYIKSEENVEQENTTTTCFSCQSYLYVKVKVARTYLYARYLCFLIAFFGRDNLTDFYDFWHPFNKEWSNFKKMLFIFLQVQKLLRYRHMFKTAFLQKMSIISKP